MVNIFTHDFVVLDTETTGFSYNQGDRIIQISAIKYINDEETNKFDTYVNPGDIENSAEFINHITKEDWSGKQNIHEIAPQLLKFIGEFPVIGHNLSFDLGFLKNEGVDINSIEENRIDTLLLARRAFHTMKGNRLTDLEKKFNFENDKQHNSLHDARTTAKIYMKLRDNYANEILKSIDCHGKRIYKKHIKAEAKEHILDGTRIVFTGQVPNKTRDEAQNYIESLGGSSPRTISKVTDYLVAGIQTAPNSKRGKLNKALEYGINIISWDELEDMIHDLKKVQ